jgi:hypothetical protein
MSFTYNSISYFLLTICVLCLQDMPGAPGMKMFSREELQKNPNLMNPGGPGNSDEDEDDDDEDEDEYDAKTSEVSSSSVYFIFMSFWSGSLCFYCKLKKALEH